MDITSIIGVVLAFTSLLVGMVLKGVSLDALLNAAAILIIIMGTISAVVIAFPTKEIKRVPRLFKKLFTEPKLADDVELIKTFSSLADKARREGLLSLENQIDEIQDAFLKNGMSLAIDGQSADYIREVLSEEVYAMEDRHASGALVFTQAGTYAPTLGVLGAVIGLIAALTDMADIDKLGGAISAAFVATLLGIFTGYVLWHPFANKLKRKSAIEVKQRMMMIEGIIAVLEGEAPRVIEQKLSAYLNNAEKEKLLKRGGSADGEA